MRQSTPPKAFEPVTPVTTRHPSLACTPPIHPPTAPTIVAPIPSRSVTQEEVERFRRFDFDFDAAAEAYKPIVKEGKQLIERLDTASTSKRVPRRQLQQIREQLCACGARILRFAALCTIWAPEVYFKMSVVKLTDGSDCTGLADAPHQVRGPG